MSKEPARIIGYTTTLITSLLGLLVAFGANISDQQQNAILGTIAAAVPVVVLIVETTRSQVVPTGKAERKINEAYYSDPDVEPRPTL